MPVEISSNAMEIYKARYLDDDADTPDKLFRRVSGGNKIYYELMSEGLFLPNSPTLFNAGKKEGGTLSACFVFDIDDTLLGDWPDGGLQSPFASSILGTTFKAACVAKAGGGVGYYLGNIREEGSLVRSTHKRACGPVTVLRFLHGLRALITQGGKRDLAQMAILPCWHPDIRKFIHCKDDDPQALSSFNISVSWTDNWLRRVDWDAVDGESKCSNQESEIWLEQAQSAWRTGDPGMFFHTTTNLHNATPHLGEINATNPCGETPNISNEPCNLGSINLWRLVRNLIRADNRYQRYLDIDCLKETVATCIDFMDDILDWNIFPHPDITRAARATRKLGLGVMGFADALALLKIPYDSQAAVDFGKSIMQIIDETALKRSIQLADIKGSYEAWDEEKSPIWAQRARNSTRTSIAPTGTISILADASSSIEPHFALQWERTTNEGIKLHEKVHIAQHLQGFIPPTANEIDLKWHIEHQAAFQAHTNLGVSKTINLPKTATVQDVSNAYRMMWEKKCKGGTVFRNECRSEQVLVVKKAGTYTLGGAAETTSLAAPTKRRKLPKERKGSTFKFNIAGFEGYVTPNVYDDGNLGEIFIELANDGSTMSGSFKAFAKTFSLALQNGTPLTDLIRLHKNCVFEPRGLTGDAEVPSCTSVFDYIVRKLERRFLPATEAKDEVIKSGQFCPDCKQELIRQGQCLTCYTPGCGFSKC